MLKRKMLRDIMDYKVQYISLFLIAFIGVLVFTGTYAETHSYETTIDNYYEETNLADGWIYSNYLVDEFLQQVHRLGATTQMERQLVVDSNAKLDNKPDITLHFVENNTISKFYVVEGKELDINDNEGVWLDKSFADAQNLKVGDKISFESNGIEITKIIRGLGYSPEYVHHIPVSTTVPDYSLMGYAYLSHNAFPSDNITYNVLDVKFSGKPETYSELVDYRLNGYYTTFLERSNHISVDIVSESITQQIAVSNIFPSIFILISMLILLTTMKRIITRQRTQIGILKAMGFNNNSILLHYLLPGFSVVTIASILGTLLGPVIFHMIANPSRTFYFKFPYWNSISFFDIAIIIPIMGMIALLVSYYSIKNIVDEPASLLIKPEIPKATTTSFVEKLLIWERLSFNVRWNYRIIKRNQFRSAMAIFGIIGCTMLLITGFGLYGQINDSEDWYFNDINHFESKLTLDDNISTSEINSIAGKVNGIPIMESSIEIIGNDTKVASLLVMDDNSLITMTDDKHQKVNIGPGDVSISQKLADILNVSVGDTIECSLLGSDKKVNISVDRIHSSPFSQGLVMTPNKMDEIGLNYTTTSIVTMDHVNESIDGITSISYLDDMIAGWEMMEETSLVLISALVIFAVLLSLVILYNLSMLSFIEMKNDILTLKVLGFQSRYLVRLFATQTILLIITGFILGIPISYYVLSILMPAFGEDIYLVPSISVINLELSLMIILSVSIVMNLYFAREIKNLDMVNLLKKD